MFAPKLAGELARHDRAAFERASVHAARDPELSRRYAAAHARTVEGIAGVLASIAERNGHALALPARQLAELLLAIETGLALEQLADPGAVSLAELPPVLGELAALHAGSPASGEIPQGRPS